MSISVSRQLCDPQMIPSLGPLATTHRQIRCALGTMLSDRRPTDKLESLLRVPLCRNLLHHPSKRLFMVRLTEMTNVDETMFPACLQALYQPHGTSHTRQRITNDQAYSRKRMFDDPWTCVHSYEHPDVEIDGQADDGLDVTAVPSCRGGYHREDQSEGLRRTSQRTIMDGLSHKGAPTHPFVRIFRFRWRSTVIGKTTPPKEPHLISSPSNTLDKDSSLTTSPDN